MKSLRTLRVRRLCLCVCLQAACIAAASAQPFVYLPNTTSGGVTVVDIATGTTTSIPGVGSNLFDGAISPDGSALWLTDFSGDALIRIELPAGSPQPIAVGGGPMGLALSPDGLRAFVANSADDTLSVVDTSSLGVLATIPVGTDPVDVGATPGRAYVANYADDTISVIDTTNLAEIGTIAVPGFPAGVAPSPDGSRVYVTTLFDGFVYTISTATDTIIDGTLVGTEPRGITTNADGSRIFAANFGSADISELDGTTGGVLRALAVGATLNPMDVLVTPDGMTLYATALPGDVLLEIDLQSALVDEIDVGCCHLAIAGASGTVLTPAPAEIPTLGAAALAVLVVVLALLGLALLRGAGPAVLLLFVALTALCAVSGIARGQDITILDTEFEFGDWEVFLASVPPGGSYSAVQEIIDGNPPPSHSIRHTHAGGEPGILETWHRYIGIGSAYDPSAAGPVTSIDISWDRELESVPATAPNLTEGFFIVQGAQSYQLQGGTGSIDSATWIPYSRNGLTAADFAPPGLDLATGGAMTFGIIRRSFPAAALDLFHQLDNFRVVLHRAGDSGFDNGTFRFDRVAYAVSEGGNVSVSVRRESGTDGAVAVTATVVGGTASVGDFTSPLPETLSWADGEGGAKALIVTAFSDADFEATETIHMRLTAPTGGAVLHASEDKTVVAIADNTEFLNPLFTLILLFIEGHSDPLWIALFASLLPLLLTLRARASRSQAASPKRAPPR